jgi:hypothetical protein
LCAVAPEIHSPHIIHPTECDFGGKKYAIGFSWLYNCRNYSCNENGQVSSVSVHCPAPNCTTTLGLHHQDKKKCCLICPEKLGSKCHFRCHRLQKVPQCSEQIVLLQESSQCCPRCYNIYKLRAVKTERCRSMSCGEHKECHLVFTTRIQEAYGPTLTVKLQCVNTTIRVLQDTCTGVNYELWLAVELSYYELSRPHIQHQFTRYLQSLLWPIAAVHLKHINIGYITNR